MIVAPRTVTLHIQEHYDWSCQTRGNLTAGGNRNGVPAYVGTVSLDQGKLNSWGTQEWHSWMCRSSVVGPGGIK
jgi:hypothetical protein